MFDATESEKYFVAGGYAVTHANSVTVSNVTKSAQKAYGSCYYQMMK
jgi:hypothetical protein